MELKVKCCCNNTFSFVAARSRCQEGQGCVAGLCHGYTNTLLSSQCTPKTSKAMCKISIIFLIHFMGKKCSLALKSFVESPTLELFLRCVDVVEGHGLVVDVAVLGK